MRGLNVGAGGDAGYGSDWVLLDKNPLSAGVIKGDVDAGALSQWGDEEFDEIKCYGCLNEFVSDVVTVMNEFWRLLKNDGKLDIKVAVVDNSLAPRGS